MHVDLEISSLSLSLENRTHTTGVYRYIYVLITELYSLLHDDLTLFVNHPIKYLKNTQIYINDHPLFSKIKFPQNISQTEKNLPEGVYFPDNGSIVHYPGQTLYRRFGSEMNQNIKTFTTVHDTIPFIHPEFYSAKTLYFLITFAKKLSSYDWLFCPSYAAKDDICNFTKANPDRVFVMHQAACPKTFYPEKNKELFNNLREEYGIPDKPYLICIGRLEDRKNTIHIMRSFIKLIEEEKIPDLNLIFCGPLTNLSKGILHFYHEHINRTQHKSRIIHSPYIDNKYLASIYSNALASIFLPIYEGFGFPALESMQCGTPIVAANNSAIPEIVGDAGFLINEHDEEAFCDSVLALYQSESLREKYIKKGLEQAKKFSWKQYVKKTHQIYKLALSS